MDAATFEIQSLFYQNAFAGCIALARQQAPSGPVDEVSLLRLVYAARASIALGDLAGARQLLGDDAESPMAMSVLFLADYLETIRTVGLEESDSILEQLQMLLDVVEPGDLSSEIVRYNVGLALFERGESQAALETLGVTGAGGSTELECIALGVHILLAIHRVDLAEKEYLAARQWGDDALLVQFMEAWIGLVRGGRSTQQAYYVYDEMSQNSNIVNTANMVPLLVGKAVAQAAQGEANAASATLSEAEALDAAYPGVAANRAVVTALSGETSADAANAAARYVIVACAKLSLIHI